MNKKGFTLVELLAVIVIIGVLLSVVVPNVLNSSENVKKKLLKTKLETIESQAEVYASDNFRSIIKQSEVGENGLFYCGQPYITVNTEYGCVSLQELVTLHYLDVDTEGGIVTNPLTGDPLSDPKNPDKGLKLYFYASANKKRVFAEIICSTLVDREELGTMSEEVCLSMHENQKK